MLPLLPPSLGHGAQVPGLGSGETDSSVDTPTLESTGAGERRFCSLRTAGAEESAGDNVQQLVIGRRMDGQGLRAPQPPAGI